MANRNKERPYLRLGNILELWRSQRHGSALELFRKRKFSFSYAAYADFERGVTLPSIRVIHELAEALEQDPTDAALLWAELQMPTAHLRSIFKSRRELRHMAPSPIDAKPSFENTWVLGARERALLLEHPWVWNLLAKLAVMHPDEVCFEELPLPAGVSVSRLVDEILQPWIAESTIQKSERGLRLRVPHVHIPKTDDWTEVRNNNVRKALEELLPVTTPKHQAAGNCYRELVYRPLTDVQAREWVEMMRRFEAQFKAAPYLTADEKGREDSYALLMMLAPRILDGV